MNKIDDFLNTHNLKSELMNDKSFVTDSKKLFEKQGMEFSKEKLEEIIGDISENLEGVRELSPQELARIVGGSQAEHPPGAKTENSSSPTTASGIAIKATTTILGTILGAGLGLILGGEYKSSTVKDPDNGDEIMYKISSKKFKPFTAVIGGGAGSILGAQLGNMIVKKYHL